MEDISNLSSAALLFVRDDRAFLLVLGRGEGRGNAGTTLCEEVEESPAAAEDEEPSLANTTGISSRDSAESEWYSAGGAAACTGPGWRARGGREALRGNAGKGSCWAKDTVDTLLSSAGGQRTNIQVGCSPKEKSQAAQLTSNTSNTTDTSYTSKTTDTSNTSHTSNTGNTGLELAQPCLWSAELQLPATCAAPECIQV